MLKLSERRRRKQARKLNTKFDKLLGKMREFGQAAGKFAQTQREPGHLYTMAQVDTMARAMVDEAKASINVPLAPFRAAGVKVDVGLDEAAMRSAFTTGFLAGIGPNGMATQGSA